MVRASILSPRVHLDIVVELESDLFGSGFVEKLFFHHVVLEIVVEHVDDVTEDLVVNQSSNAFFVSLLDSSHNGVPVRRLLRRRCRLSCEGKIIEVRVGFVPKKTNTYYSEVKARSCFKSYKMHVTLGFSIADVLSDRKGESSHYFV